LIENFQEAIAELKGKLPEYLESLGIDPSQKFLCPVHNEDTPSCGLSSDEQHIHCWGCGIHYDIIDLAAMKENLPPAGGAFVETTLKTLCERFSIELKSTPLSADQLYRLEVYRAFKVAAQFVASRTGKCSKEVTDHLKKRGWNDETLQVFMTGHVPSYKVFLKHMEDNGFTSQFLHEVDLDRSDIFHAQKLIFTYADEHGEPVGFTARDCTWEPGNKSAKYINQRTTGVKFDLLQKRRRLFGLHIARQYPELILAEGQGDVLSAHQAGIPNVVALGHSNLTEDQALVLEELGIRDIILCLDGDIPGKAATLKIVDERLPLHKEIRAKIIDLPEGYDLDDCFNIPTFNLHTMPRPIAFEWRLKKYLEDGEDPETVAKKMIPLIVSEMSHITREDRARVLSKHTGYPLETIKSEIQRLTDQRAAKTSQDRDLILRKMQREIDRSPGDAEAIISAARTQLLDTAIREGAGRFSQESCLRFLEQQKEAQELKDENPTGFVLGTDLKILEQQLCGEWRKDVLIMLGGRANSGKSSLLAKLAYDIARHEENNACVIYHSIDDSAAQILPKFISVAEGSKTGITINEIIHPKYWKSKGWDCSTRREAGYAAIKDLVADGRLILKDVSDGTSLAFAEQLVTYYQQKYPDRQVVYILDNFHKLPDQAGTKGDDERVRVKRLSSLIKELATRHHIPVICTVEYTKMQPGTRPSDDNIGESVQLNYDGNLTMHLYNDFNDFAGKSNLYHEATIHGKSDVKLPLMELIVSKNKISSYKGSLYFRFYPHSSDFAEASREDLERMAQGS